MAELVQDRTEEAPAAAAEVDDWEVDEILTRFDRAGEGRDTRAGGTTSCH
jgi:hypothetical protein